MELEKNRLWLGAIVMVALVGLAIWAVQTRTSDTPLAADLADTAFPDLSRDQIAVIEITRPEDDVTIRLERQEPAAEGEPAQPAEPAEGEDAEDAEPVWRVAQPIAAEADQSAVETALDKLDELEMTGIAATTERFHERLEVDAEHAVHVVARGSDGNALIDMWIGAFRSGSTLIRLEGDPRVYQVRGSIKFAFNKELKDWRDRTVLDVEADEVREVAWVGPNGTFRFVRAEVAAAAAEGQEAPPEPTLGDWQMAEVSYMPAPTAQADVDAGPRRPRAPEPPAPTQQTTIESFAPTKVRSMVGSLARLRASDFAAADVTPEAAGITASAPRVTLAVGEGDSTQTYTLRLGNESNAERHDFYLMREGEPTVYVVSRFLSERVNPNVSSFQQAPAAAPAEGAAAPPAAPPEGEAPPAGGGQDIPPEVLEQIRRQLQQQGVSAVPGEAPPQ